MTSSQEPLPPTALAGRFTLLAELGTGSSGTVHRARLTRSYRSLPAGTEVAVKFLRQDRMGDPEARERLLAEGRLGRRVRSPHVAAIHGVETLEVLGLESTYLVMEYVEGHSLGAFLDSGAPAVEDFTRRVGCHAARGLAALHALGVVHRDVKPENLALTPEGHVVILDLGLARRTGARGAASSGGFAGSVRYAAPEVLAGGRATARSDLYSLGAVLYEVATGRHPFADATEVDALIHAHLHLPPPRPSHHRPRISAFLEEVLLALLAKDPDRRAFGAAELAATLEEGEGSRWWRRFERTSPTVASRRRLRRLRRSAPTAFQDRGRERAFLDERRRAAADGRGSAVVVHGPQGAGRRRLLDEAIASWLEDGTGIVFLGGEADDDPGRARGLPFSEALTDWFLRGDRPDSPNLEERLAARIRDETALGDGDARALAANLARRGTADAPEERADTMVRALLGIARGPRTLVLRVDRAEHLDTTGRLVVEHLVEEAPGQRVLLLLVCGTDWQPGELPCHHLEIRGLDAGAFRAFADGLFLGGRAPAEVLAAHPVLLGHPGQLVEALDHLVDRGAMRGRPGGYEPLGPLEELRPAPPHLARVLDRVAGLPESQRHVLQAAAVLGERFPVADLAALTGRTELQVLESLSLFRGRVVHAQGGTVVFRHRDFRHALLRGMPTAVRRRLHRLAAWVLDDRGAPDIEVGLHLSRALEHTACMEPLLAGLEGLVAAGSRRSSQRVAARVRAHLDHLESGGGPPDVPSWRLRYLLAAAGAARLAHRGDRAATALQAAARQAHEIGDRIGHAAALTGLAGTDLDAGRLLAALGRLESVHATLGLPESDDQRLRAARAHGLHGRVLAHLGQSEDGLHHVREALRLVPPGHDELRANLQIDLARLEALRRHFPTALKNLQRIAEGPGTARTRVRTRVHRGQVLAVIGAPDAADALAAAATEAHRLSLHRDEARALVHLAGHLAWSGAHLAARRQAEAARVLAERAGDRPTATLAALRALPPGDADGELGRTVEELGIPALQALWLLGEAERHRLAGRGDLVRVHLDEALDLARAADLPFLLEIDILRRAGRERSARLQIAAVARRLPRELRRPFLAWMR